MPDLSKAAEAALPAFLELMHTASRDQLPADELWVRMTALGTEHRLQGPGLGDAFLFAVLIHVRELGGDAAAYRTRDAMARVADRLIRGNKDGDGDGSEHEAPL
ncbi:MAG TPA: hypothetical protein VGO40_03470 [Longimicrobium sp.]|jgi:hypothetical protein|nr:hypothetical protein [Longimicrobium sp.]